MSNAQVNTVGRKFKRTVQFVARPFRPMLKHVVLPINSGLARGLKGYVGQWTIPLAVDAEEEFLGGLDLTGRIVYDVGANVGAMTLFFARAVGPNGRVISFEPNREALRLLSDHVAINRFENVRVYGVAVGEANKQMRLAVPVGRRGSGRLAANADVMDGCDSYTVDVVRLDDFVRNTPSPPPGFVKIDTEGFELACLVGMQSILASERPALYLEMHGATPGEKEHNSSEIINLLCNHGYEVYHVESRSFVSIETCQRAARGHLFACAMEDALYAPLAAHRLALAAD